MAKQPMIVGEPVLVVVDMQQGDSMPAEESGIAIMPGHSGRVTLVVDLVAAARAALVPVVFVQEVHHPSGIDFGRELDGAEDVHCIAGNPDTELEPSLRPCGDPKALEFLVVKRRYSAFIGTDFDIILRGVRASTLILVGGLTDVCVHYTFADAHQRDYYARVVSDCVGGSSQAAHDASLNAMEYLQGGAVRTSDEILAAFTRLAAERTSSKIAEVTTTHANA